MPRSFSLSVVSNPLITDKTTISTMTPTATPPTEIRVISEMNPWRRRDLRYRRLTKNSYMVITRLRVATGDKPA